MNQVEILAKKLGFPDLLNSNRDQINSAVRQVISFYLKEEGYTEAEIAKMQRKSRASIYHHVKTFIELYELKDPIIVRLYEKLQKECNSRSIK